MASIKVINHSNLINGRWHLQAFFVNNESSARVGKCNLCNKFISFRKLYEKYGDIYESRDEVRCHHCNKKLYKA